MKFPITRETLQAFSIEEEQAERREIAINNHINALVGDICAKLDASIMPIDPTRRDITWDHRMQHTQKKILAEKRFIWDQLQNIRVSNILGNQTVINAEIPVLIERLIQKLKETFIGCDIITDPLKTYLIIDWS